MVTITSLWLPILLSAVAVFIVSSIIHMVLTYHRSDYRKLPNEAEVMGAMRSHGVVPGQYHFPYAPSPKEMSSPEMTAKYQEGPVGLMTVLPNGPPAMGKALVQWFLFSLVIGVFVAYLTGRTVGPGTPYLSVFRLAGTVAFLGYGAGELLDAIWKGQSWSATSKNVFDGLVYALTTAGMFGWLWPS